MGEQLSFMLTPEPLPKHHDDDVWAEIIASLPEGRLRGACSLRRRFGIDKYGTPVHRESGRDHLRDLFDEVLDGCVYSKALDGDQRLSPKTRARLHRVMLDLAAEVLDLILDGDSELEQVRTLEEGGQAAGG